MLWAWAVAQFWRACFPLMKRQRAEPLADREHSLLPLLGHRREEDLGGRAQVEFNLVAGSDPTHKRSMGFAENAVKQIELGTKYIMAENSLPIEWFALACDQAAEIRNLLSYP